MSVITVTIDASSGAAIFNAEENVTTRFTHVPKAVTPRCGER